MLMSVCFICLCNSTHRKLRCVGNNVPLLVNDIRTRRGNACVRILLQDRAPLHAQSAIQSSESSCKRLYQLPLDLVASPASQAYVKRLFSLCGDLTASKRNSTKVFRCRRVFLKLNRQILHWIQCTVNWSVTCFWYCRTAEDTLQRLRSWLLLTYLCVVISHTTLTYNKKCQN